jgi:transcription initiation factor TFIIB
MSRAARNKDSESGTKGDDDAMEKVRAPKVTSLRDIDASLVVPKRCPNCGKWNTFVLDSGSGEMVCSNCGFVLKENIEETGPEWWTGGEEGSKSKARAGSPTNLARSDMGLSTAIGSENSDASGKSLGASKSSLERLRRWDRRTQVHSSKERDLARAFEELRVFSDKLNLSSSIVERAAYIYRKALEKNLIKGRSIDGMITAALYTAIREYDIPRTIKNVAALSRTSVKSVRRDYRLIVEELDLKLPIFDPRRLVSSISRKVGLREKTELRAIELVKRAEDAGIATGKEPMAVAAAAVYLATRIEPDPKTEKEISAASGLSDVTIRKRYTEIRDVLGIKVPR